MRSSLFSFFIILALFINGTIIYSQDKKQANNPAAQLIEQVAAAAKTGIEGILAEQKQFFNIRVREVSVASQQVTATVRVRLARLVKPKRVQMLKLEMFQEEGNFLLTDDSIQAVLRFVNIKQKEKQLDGIAIEPVEEGQSTTQGSFGIRAISTTDAAKVARVIELVNKERTTRGLPALVNNAQLTQAAQLHAEDMARQNYFSHTGLDGRSPFDRMRAAGYLFRAAGENIAAGQTTPEAVMTTWMNSSGHRANILSTNFRDIGVGLGTNSLSRFKIYWVQCFGRR